MEKEMKSVLASLSMFTRLPFWRLATIPQECYERVVPLWPLAGWLTGGVMALVLWVASLALPMGICVVLALVARVLLTGALHEDGFADFCDGFGGGTSRERTLQIMKDSHIGTYGVLGLVLYYLLMYNGLTYIFAFRWASVLLLVAADAFAKLCSSQIINLLPYARKAEDAKTRLVYQRMTLLECLTGFVLGITPCIALAVLCPVVIGQLLCACAASVVAALLMIALMHRRLQGYTGDCCGATFIVTEAVFYLALAL